MIKFQTLDIRLLKSNNCRNTYVLLDSEVLNNISENMNVHDLAHINMRSQLNQSHRLATFLIGLADICLINIEEWSCVSHILQMVCKTFLKFKTQDENFQLQPTKCLFIDQEFKDISTLDWFIRQNEMIVKLNETTKTSAEIINPKCLNSKFNDIIKIENDEMRESFRSLLLKFERHVEDQNYSLLNSIKLSNTIVKRSIINDKYINQVHEIAEKLFEMFASSQLNETELNLSGNSKSSKIKILQSRLNNLTKLINSENFVSADIETWRMGTIYEQYFKQRWQNRSDQLSKLTATKRFRKILISSGIDETFLFFRDEIVHEELGIIKAISETDLTQYFKERLKLDMKNQINKKMMTEQTQFKRKLLETKFNKFTQAFQTEEISDLNQLDEMIENFSSSDILSSNLESLKQDMHMTKDDLDLNFRCYAIIGLHFVLDSEMESMAVQSLFPSVQSIDDWKVTTQEILSIEVMRDPDYFRTNSLSQKIVNKEFMPELFDGFTSIINESLSSKASYDQSVDEKMIREICVSFKKKIDLTIQKYGIDDFVKPKFIVVCLVFAIFKMLPGRFYDTLDRNSKQDESVEHLDIQDFLKMYEKMLVLQINDDDLDYGRSQLQKDFIFFTRPSFETTSFNSAKLILTYMNRISINETDGNEVLGVFSLEDKTLERDVNNHIRKSNTDQGQISSNKTPIFMYLNYDQILFNSTANF